MSNLILHTVFMMFVDFFISQFATVSKTTRISGVDSLIAPKRSFTLRANITQYLLPCVCNMSRLPFSHKVEEEHAIQTNFLH